MFEYGLATYRDQPQFFDRAGVQQYVDKKGKEQLVALVVAQLLDSISTAHAKAWLEIDRQREAREAATLEAALAAERHDLERRNTAAAERSAEAAKQSAKWAGWAIVMSLLAVVVSVFSFLYART